MGGGERVGTLGPALRRRGEKHKYLYKQKKEKNRKKILIKKIY